MVQESLRPAVQMANITKRFPGVLANDNVSLTVYEGTLHAVIGENGAGKSTLMNILFGRYQPDSGRIRVRERDVTITNPAAAIQLGMGMVSQHTTMIPALSLLENVLLGQEPCALGVLRRQAARQRLAEISNEFGIALDWEMSASSASIAALQKAEIVKALYRDASILILDEPTSALSPMESEALFSLLRALAQSGRTILFITHKLRDVVRHGDRVTVMRGGRSLLERPVRQVTEEELLTYIMGGRAAVPMSGDLDAAAPPEPIPDPWKKETERPPLVADVPLTASERPQYAPVTVPFAAPVSDAPPLPLLEAIGLSVAGDRHAVTVQDITLRLAPGEIVGVAGVDGSGQKELAEALVGLRAPHAGSILLDGHDVTSLPVRERLRLGLAYMPADSRREGLILDFTLAENLLLGRHRDPRFGGGRLLDWPSIEVLADRTLLAHRVKAADSRVPARSLSGGNQQKVLLARGLAGPPRVLVAMQPTRGLDAHATRMVYDALRERCRNGMAVLLFSLDLDEILEAATRVVVMFQGRLVGDFPRSQARVDEIGRLMVTGDGGAAR